MEPHGHYYERYRGSRLGIRFCAASLDIVTEGSAELLALRHSELHCPKVLYSAFIDFDGFRYVVLVISRRWLKMIRPRYTSAKKGCGRRWVALAF